MSNGMPLEFKGVGGDESVLENAVEQYLTREVKKIGGISRKWSSPSHRGVPDRILFFDNGQIYFVEVKRSHGKPTALQLKEVKILRKYGLAAVIVYGKEGVDLFIERVKRDIYADS